MICLRSLCLCFALCLRLGLCFALRLALRRCSLSLRCLGELGLRCLGHQNLGLGELCLRLGSSTCLRCLCLRNRRLILLGNLGLRRCFRYSLRLCRRCACLGCLCLRGTRLRCLRLRRACLRGLCLRRTRLRGLRLRCLRLRRTCLHLCLCCLALLRHYCLCLISDGRDACLLKDHGKGQQHRQIPFYPVSSVHTSFSFHSAFFCFTEIQVSRSVLHKYLFSKFLSPDLEFFSAIQNHDPGTSSSRICFSFSLRYVDCSLP